MLGDAVRPHLDPAFGAGPHDDSSGLLHVTVAVLHSHVAREKLLHDVVPTLPALHVSLNQLTLNKYLSCEHYLV